MFRSGRITVDGEATARKADDWMIPMVDQHFYQLQLPSWSISRGETMGKPTKIPDGRWCEIPRKRPGMNSCPRNMTPASRKHTENEALDNFGIWGFRKFSSIFNIQYSRADLYLIYCSNW